LPLLFDPDGSARVVESGQGAPLGLFDNVAVDEQVVSGSPGSIFLLYTGGATDITGPGEVLFGLDQL
jgi:serine phosphatase RsbU (regulator of sigma subunit)